LGGAPSTRQKWDAVYCFSGVSEELLDALKEKGRQAAISQSSHIVHKRNCWKPKNVAGRPIDRPSGVDDSSEEREYAKADVIVTLSGSRHGRLTAPVMKTRWSWFHSG